MLRFVIPMLASGCVFGADAEPEPEPPREPEIPLSSTAPVATASPDDECDFLGGSGAADIDRCTGGETFVFAVSAHSIGREDPAGIAPGFDRDGHDTDPDDEAGCGHPDFRSPDGRTGIDNQLATLAPTYESAFGADVQSEVADAIASGGYGIVIEVAHWDGTPDDECVDVVVYEARPREVPALDEDGRIAPGQLYAPVPRSHRRRFEEASVRGGVLRAGLGGFPLPPFRIDVFSAHLEAEITPAGLRGVVAGELPVEGFAAQMGCDVVAPPEFLRTLLDSVADLRPDDDGVCRSLSGAVVIAAVPAVLEE